MTARQAIVLIRNLPRESRLLHLQHPDDAEWGLSEQLLAANFDLLQWANWQRAGDKHAPKPKPLPRPGVTSRQTRRHGQTHLSREEALAILRPDNDATEGGDDGD